MNILNLTFPISDKLILARIFRKQFGFLEFIFYKCKHNICQKYSTFVNSDFKKRSLYIVGLAVCVSICFNVMFRITKFYPGLSS
jgi:hypothetical protein